MQIIPDEHTILHNLEGKNILKYNQYDKSHIRCTSTE